MLDLNIGPSFLMGITSLKLTQSLNINPDFLSLLGSTSQNLISMSMDSSVMLTPQLQFVQYNDIIVPTNEWSTNTIPCANSS